MMAAVTTAAVVSLAGRAYHTPFSPQNWGSTQMNGSRNSNWRDSERKMLIFTRPMHWKKFVVTAWKPMMGNTSMFSLMPVMDFAMRSASSVKMRAM